MRPYPLLGEEGPALLRLPPSSHSPRPRSSSHPTLSPPLPRRAHTLRATHYRLVFERADGSRLLITLPLTETTRLDALCTAFLGQS